MIKSKGYVEIHIAPNLYNFDRRSYLKKCANLVRRYGISLKQRDELIINQDYKCAICLKNLLKEESKRVHVDHCHDTGKIRGILCHYCNAGIGHFEDDLNLLQRAVIYLENNYNE